MSEGISYTAKENLMRIQMEKNTKFILVEGVTDIAIYESFLRGWMSSHEIDSDFEVVDGGGKESILEFLNDTSIENLKSILDMDFDKNKEFNDVRVVVLDKYSIENYVISSDCIIPVIAVVMNESETSIRTWFNLEPWEEHCYSVCSLLLMSLVYHQAHISENREAWGKSVLVMDGRRWEISESKVSKLIKKIMPVDVTKNDVITYFPFRPLTKNKFVSLFPGKLSLKSVYQYVKKEINDRSKVKIGRYFNNEQSFTCFSAAFLVRDKEFTKIMKPVLNFLS